MPISPAYSWTETSTIVTVTAQCRNATTASTDVYSSPFYVSFNAPPYFLELDLFAAIDSTRSVATARKGSVILKLFKAEEKQWGQLVVDLPRQERLKRREASRDLAAEEAQAAVERKKREKWDDSRFSLGKQMDKDRADRERLEGYKAAEKEAEAAERERGQREAIGDKAGAGGWAAMNTPIISAAARQGGVDDLSKAAGLGAKKITDLRDRRRGTPEQQQPPPQQQQQGPPPHAAKAKANAKAPTKAKKAVLSEAAGDVIVEDSGLVEITPEEEEAVPPLAEAGDAIFDVTDAAAADEEDEEDEEEEPAATGAVVDESTSCRQIRCLVVLVLGGRGGEQQQEERGRGEGELDAAAARRDEGDGRVHQAAPPRSRAHQDRQRRLRPAARPADRAGDVRGARGGRHLAARPRVAQGPRRPLLPAGRHALGGGGLLDGVDAVQGLDHGAGDRLRDRVLLQPRGVPAAALALSDGRRRLRPRALDHVQGALRDRVPQE